MTFAIIHTGGKQYKVAEGDIIKVEKLPVPKDGKTVVFDEVLLVDDGKETKVGNPYLSGTSVTAEYVQEGRHDKITVIHYKAKIRYKKKYGHRQPFTELKISAIK